MTLGDERGRGRERALVKSMYQACAGSSAVRCGAVQCSECSAGNVSVWSSDGRATVRVRWSTFRLAGWQLNLPITCGGWWLVAGRLRFKVPVKSIHTSLQVLTLRGKARQGKARKAALRYAAAALSSVPRTQYCMTGGCLADSTSLPYSRH
jgi:hypothetical protein